MSQFASHIIFLLSGLFFISCTGSKQVSESTAIAYTHTNRLKKKQRVHLVHFAKQQLNVPYVWGGNTPKGFDCSGFTSYCFKHFGIQLPRTAIDQSVVGKKVRSKKAKVGDLIFFEGSDQRQNKVAHVGIIVSGKKKNIQFIHAASKGVRISQLSEDYFYKRFKTIRRIRA